MDNSINGLIRATSKSLCVSWGTTAPYSAGTVRCCRVGYADIPCVEVVIFHKYEDNLTAIARQLVYRELEACGLCSDCLALTPMVGKASRRRKVTDRNESSRAFGKNKMLSECTYRFEITDRDAIPAIRNCLPRSFGGSKL